MKKSWKFGIFIIMIFIGMILSCTTFNDTNKHHQLQKKNINNITEIDMIKHKERLNSMIKESESEKKGNEISDIISFLLAIGEGYSNYYSNNKTVILPFFFEKQLKVE